VLDSVVQIRFWRSYFGILELALLFTLLLHKDPVEPLIAKGLINMSAKFNARTGFNLSFDPTIKIQDPHARVAISFSSSWKRKGASLQNYDTP